MTFVEFLKSQGMINHEQIAELNSFIRANHEKPGQAILKKNFLPKNELLKQLQVFITKQEK